VGAALGALDVIETHPNRGKELLKRVSWFRTELRNRGFTVPCSETQIIPVQVGTIPRTVAIAKALRDRGIWAFAIRPPTVPPDSTCIRFSLSLGHTEDMCMQALDLLSEVCDGIENAD
jgi:8-amino-7-oxononanoate synthase